MSKVKALLSKYVGEEGFDVLSKAIYRKQTNTFADPLELYLPLLAVPRTILSWLVQNIKPMSVDEHKVFQLPGIEGAEIHVHKQASDVYKGEVIQDGKVIHVFENQSLPSIGGHIMTITESYDHIKDAKDSPPEGDDHFEPNYEAPKVIASHVISRSLDEDEMRRYSTLSGSCNVSQSLKIIGKLVDALVSKKMETESVEKELIEKEEIDGDSHKPEQSKTPEEIGEERLKEMEKDKAIRTKQGDAGFKVKVMSDKEEVKTIESSAIEEVKSHDDHKPEKSKKTFKSVFKKDEVSKSSNIESKPKPLNIVRQAAAQSDVQRISNTGVKSQERETADTLREVKASSQLDNLNYGKRSSRVAAPTKFPRLKASDLNDMLTAIKQISDRKKVKKSGEMPSGAAIPKGPKPPMAPKQAVMPSKNPAAAEKQTRASAKGLPPPKLKSGQAIKSPAGPKSPSMNTAKVSKPTMTTKSELVATVSKNELFSRQVKEMVGEFLENRDGTITYKPNIEFLAADIESSGKKTWFVDIKKNDDNTYKMIFNPKVEEDSVHAFLLAMKARLLIQKKYKV